MKISNNWLKDFVKTELKTERIGEFLTDIGLEVEGIDKFNMNVDNATGFFKSTAKVEGNQLILTASKGYKTISEKKEAWPDMVKFLDEAYKFTQLKVVLKKA